MADKKVGRLSETEVNAIRRLWNNGNGPLTLEQLVNETGRSETAVRTALGLPGGSTPKSPSKTQAFSVTMGGKKVMVHLPLGSAPGGKFTFEEETALIDLVASLRADEEEEPVNSLTDGYKTMEEELEEVLIR